MRFNRFTLLCLFAFIFLISRQVLAQDQGKPAEDAHPKPASSPAPSPPPRTRHTTHSSGPTSHPPTTAAKPAPTSTTATTVATTSVTKDNNSTTSTSDDTKKTTHKETKTASSDINIPTFQSNGTYNAASGALPIQPEITPAFGLAGTVLIITGLAYAAIGVRHRILSTFLSTAYLVAVSVTVLILYVVNPPVSEGVQAAYFVAALVSGCIAGGLALVFSEVTQCLGCVLGGFCLSMWILQFKSGGLIESVPGRITLIAALSAGTFVLSFSKYTRDYALMVCTAFSGATATLIGIDCFSCQGMKEFWVYIWALNNRIFPLRTNTYPLTRGNKVEIAAIIILALCGFLSQFKLYQIIKEKRKKKKQARAQEDEDREHLDAEVGRKLEDSNERERAQWEMTYGTESMGGSTITLNSTLGGANSTKGVGKPDSVVVEMKEMGASKRSSQSSMRTVNTGKPTTLSRRIEEEGTPRPSGIETKDFQSRTGSLRPPPSRPGAGPPTRNSSRPTTRNSSFETPRQFPSRTQSLKPTAPPPPPVVPLPFVVPPQPPQDRSDVVSIATMGDSVVDMGDIGPAPKRQSLRRGPAKLAGAGQRGNPFDQDSSDESGDETSGRPVPHVDDDRSSVAATLDELDEEQRALPASRSPTPPKRTDRRTRDRAVDRSSLQRPSSTSGLRLSMASQASSNYSASHKRRSSAPTMPEIDEQLTKEKQQQEALEPAKVLGLKTLPSARRRSEASSKHSRPASKHSILSSDNPALPDLLPHYAIQFRTNEWAKHLTAADKPEWDELDDTAAGVAIDYAHEESAAPVDVNELKQTNTTTQLAAAKHPVIAANQAVSRVPKNLAAASNQVQPAQRDSVQPGIARTTSNQTMNNRNSILRTASNPVNGMGPAQLLRSSSQPLLSTQGAKTSGNPVIGQTLVESPIEHQTYFPQSGLMPAGQAISNLPQAQRNAYAQPFAPFAPAPIPTYAHAVPMARAMSDTASVRSLPGDMDSDNVSLSSRRAQLVGKPMDDDNISLSERRQMIYNGVMDPSVNYSLPAQYVQQQQMMYGPSYSNGMYQAAPQPQATWPLPGGPLPGSMGPVAPVGNNQVIYDSHQPHRGPRIDPYAQQAKLANWRESVRQDLVGGPSQQVRHAADERRRQAMLQERRQIEFAKQQKEWQASARDMAFDERMRNGEMLDLHRDALKRMQSGAAK